MITHGASMARSPSRDPHIQGACTLLYHVFWSSQHIRKCPGGHRVILYYNGLFLGSAIIFHWLFCIQYEYLLSTCGACLEIVFEFEWRATYCGSLRVKLILAPLGILKRVWPSTKRVRTFFIQTCTLPPSMHRNFFEHGRNCMQNIHFPMKNYVYLEDHTDRDRWMCDISG
jgi:hypothetical protein